MLGLGNVGKGVWNILKVNKQAIMKRSGYDIEIAKILVRDKSKKGMLMFHRNSSLQMQMRYSMTTV